MPRPLLRRSLWALVIVALAIVVAVVALPYIASTRIVRDRIAGEISDWSGLKVSIGGSPHISVWPRFQAVLTDVSMSMPDGPSATTGHRDRADGDRPVGFRRAERQCRVFDGAPAAPDAARRPIGHGHAGTSVAPQQEESDRRSLWRPASSRKIAWRPIPGNCQGTGSASSPFLTDGSLPARATKKPSLSPACRQRGLAEVERPGEAGGNRRLARRGIQHRDQRGQAAAGAGRRRNAAEGCFQGCSHKFFLRRQGEP